MDEAILFAEFNSAAFNFVINFDESSIGNLHPMAQLLAPSFEASEVLINVDTNLPVALTITI